MSSPAKPEQYTDAQLDIFCAECPWLALEHDAHRLTPEQIEVCFRASAWAVIMHAPHQLTEEQLRRACCSVYAELVFELAADRLTPEKFDVCYGECPWLALIFAANRLDQEQLLDCVAQYRVELNDHLKDNYNKRLVDALNAVIDQLDSETAKSVRHAIAKAM